ncbi:hypothetical protein [Streptomyces sp. NPDC002156]
MDSAPRRTPNGSVREKTTALPAARDTSAYAVPFWSVICACSVDVVALPWACRMTAGAPGWA